MDPTCGFEGESDLYGLGIRIGVYLQWLTGLLVYVFYPEGYADVSTTTLIFSTAITIGTIVNSSERYASEIFIFLYLFLGGIFITVVLGEHSPYYGAKESRISMFKLLCTVACCFAGSVYSAWFWLEGLMTFFQQSPCGENWGLVFRRVDLYSPGVYKAMGALSCICAVSSGLGLLWFVKKAGVALYKKDRQALRTPRVDTGAQPTYQTGIGAKKTGSRDCHIDLTPLVGFAVFVHSVVGIELTLRWNHISDVYTIRSLGQLIPFVIAVVEFLRFAFKLGKKWRKQRSSARDDHDEDVEYVAAASKRPLTITADDSEA
ncbi:hypothetical protein K491DRAFT_676410 [Lophiostoma macrostomum CBS 122681]|uniref:Uncharacterized protein n=1 Tax=Lophiostoma macrostomum CBS 122681 TaxID=1314788 RepID=A0A6A6TI87_9PLEO|nr:hypothetical protein K491DRAFT_676410 [Lophiostoma macrostomum CBS 122681]